VVYVSRKTVALHLDEEIYQEYRKFCQNNAIILSRKIDDFMKKELKRPEK
jgi:hypothetical protein